MKNVAEFIEHASTRVYIDLDAVTCIERVVDPTRLTILIPFRRYDNIRPVAAVTQTPEEAVESVLNRWWCGHGRPEIIQVFAGCDGPVTRTGPTYLDLSDCWTFSVGSSIYTGPYVEAIMKGKNAVRRMFFIEKPENISFDSHAEHLVRLWRKAKGEL
jgi:hypothetical protein